MSKKILSVMLALVMVMSVFSVVSFAAVHTEYEKGADIKDETGTVVDQEPVEQTQYWSLETDNVADANGKYTVNVVLETNYAVGAISFAIVAEGATLEKAVEGAALTAAAGFNADVRLDKVKNIVYIVPDPAEEGTEAPVLAAGSVVAKLTFSLTAESATVALMNDARLVNNAGTLIAARPADGLLACDTLVYGQRVIDENGDDVELDAELASVTLGEEAAEPVLTGANTSVVIDTKKTFGGKYTGAVYGLTCSRFTATNVKNQFKIENGTITFEASSGGNGTGSKILVYNLAGELVSTYVVVVFGDVNGDGAINGPDLTKLKAHITKPALVSGTPEFMAANLAASFTRSPNGPDLTMMKARVTSASAYSQGDMAKNHTSYSN